MTDDSRAVMQEPDEADEGAGVGPDHTDIMHSSMDEFDTHQLRKMNAVKVGELASMGIGMDPTSLIMTRLESFIDFVLPPEQEARWAFEKTYETFIGERLDAAATEARKATLLQGIQNFGKN